MNIFKTNYLRKFFLSAWEYQNHEMKINKVKTI